MERPDRLGQLHGRVTSPRRFVTSPKSRPPSPTATSRRRSPSTCAARSSSSRTRSTRWSTSSTGSPREVTRVAREVGSEGKLGGQAEVVGVAGTWKDLTDSVNFMAGRTSPRRSATSPTSRPPLRNGDLSKKITVDVRGEILELKDTINTMVDQLNAFASRGHARRARSRLRRQARRSGRRRRRRRHVERSHRLRQLDGRQPHIQVRNIADVTTAVANGDLSKKITVDVRGEILELKHDQHDGRPAQRLRVGSHARRARSRLRRKARRTGEVAGVGGTWKDLTDSVNFMAVEPHLASAQHRRRHDRRRQRRPFEEDHRRRARRNPRAQGHRSTRWSTSSTPSPREVTRVAREVGSEGKLGGQAAGARRRRHVERPHRLGQLHGLEPDLAGS